MSTTFRRLSGTSLSTTAFQLRETSSPVDVATVLAVLDGELAAYLVHGFVAPAACDRIAKNFWASNGRVPRYGVGEDGVEAYLIGASHYGKPTLTYLEEAAICKDHVENLYAGTTNPVASFRHLLATETGITVRAASFGGFPAGDSKAIYWNNVGTFLLEPHEDLAQVRDPIQAGFEIQEVKRVMAVNIYAAVPERAGQLQVWNVEPDEETRADLGLSGVGFPYPAELLDEHASLVIEVQKGDLCVINGNLVHAVVRGAAASGNNRLLLTCFTGLNLGNELIWWT